jgi:NAD(P)-dependent dehydrogenase (short-subunit alcohol dehydrogenase family)
MMNERKVVLVTGVSSGIGRETAQLLAERGFRVFGSARNPRRVDAISGVEMVQLDVTDDASATESVQSVLREAGRLDALVNNAGYALAGALEETSLQEAHEQFETNFFGVLRMVNAVLPAMRAQASGRIVNVSSVVGVIPEPYMGIYVASKHALEGYTETLDHEVRQFGIRVSLVEPGFTRTGLGANGKTTNRVLGAYAAQREQALAFIQEQVRNGAGTRSVAEAIQRALTASSPRLRYRVGRPVRLVIALKWLLPEAVFYRLVRRVFQIPEINQLPAQSSAVAGNH